ncbi:hypothetical protein [Methylobacterium sp. J-076]|uniref:hypothetical protein n=1 Tax=Methylobacterium sp. J-076 TaxID=2836655 RepID=UPI001FBADEC2|nr:hypothetical protein [Methylobacterium sp. J-076]MCJ2011546.1 hypothetical protein [Methylobacterium sp. J-076]
MPLLARKIDRDATWAEAEDYLNDEDFPYEAMYELREGRALGKGGLSLFECAGPADGVLAQVAASFYMSGDQKNAPSKIYFRFVHTDDLDRAQITYSKTKGKLLYAPLNDLHYDITGLTGPKALILAKLLLNSEQIEIPQKTITFEITRGLRVGSFDKSAAKEKCLHFVNSKNGLEFLEDRLKF